ncbi:GvpL/GvpF family gas vesicle protein [Streptomyces sp. NPDC085946]|uniref:GvpL/GvpF family gas vesicle protein n=1 Tax=Streptomyces sp. NPDC085946 TaxID=3365744 RepID=UPI0037D7084B
MTTYVYGIAHASHPSLPLDADGIGEPPYPVRTLQVEDLVAIVSDAPDDLRPKRRDLLAHQDVLAKAGEGGVVLPMRFGNLAPNDEAVAAVLAEHAAHYLQRLQQLDGMAEYNIKASHQEEAVLRLVMAQNDDIRTLVEETRQAGGGSQEEKLELGEMVAAAIQALEDHDAARLQQELEPAAAAVSVGQQSTGWLANLSFLVERDKVDRFLAAVDKVRQEYPHLELRVHGPLPPYSFVQPPT